MAFKKLLLALSGGAANDAPNLATGGAMSLVAPQRDSAWVVTNQPNLPGVTISGISRDFRYAQGSTPTTITGTIEYVWTGSYGEFRISFNGSPYAYPAPQIAYPYVSGKYMAWTSSSVEVPQYSFTLDVDAALLPTSSQSPVDFTVEYSTFGSEKRHSGRWLSGQRPMVTAYGVGMDWAIIPGVYYVASWGLAEYNTTSGTRYINAEGTFMCACRLYLDSSLTTLTATSVYDYTGTQITDREVTLVGEGYYFMTWQSSMLVFYVKPSEFAKNISTSPYHYCNLYLQPEADLFDATTVDQHTLRSGAQWKGLYLVNLSGSTQTATLSLVNNITPTVHAYLAPGGVGDGITTGVLGVDAGIDFLSGYTSLSLQTIPAGMSYSFWTGIYPTGDAPYPSEYLARYRLKVT